MRAFMITMMIALGAAEARAEKPVTVSGLVREVAGGPAGQSAVQLKTDDGRTLTLRGRTAADDDEIRRLGGMKVRVHAVEGDPGLPATGGYVRVDRYEIIDVGGAAPRTGVLAELDLEGTRRLIFVADDGTADLLPAGWVKKMSKHVGARMWMIGTKNPKGGLHPSRHGILRPGPRSGTADEETQNKPKE